MTLRSSVTLEQIDWLSATFSTLTVVDDQLVWTEPDWLKLLRTTAEKACPSKCGHDGLVGIGGRIECNHCFLRPNFGHRLRYNDRALT